MATMIEETITEFFESYPGSLGGKLRAGFRLRTQKLLADWPEMLHLNPRVPRVQRR